MRQDSYGTYKCYAENEHGAAVKFVKYEYAGKTFSIFNLFTVNLFTGIFTCNFIQGCNVG